MAARRRPRRDRPHLRFAPSPPSPAMGERVGVRGRRPLDGRCSHRMEQRALRARPPHPALSPKQAWGRGKEISARRRLRRDRSHLRFASSPSSPAMGERVGVRGAVRRMAAARDARSNARYARSPLTLFSPRWGEGKSRAASSCSPCAIAVRIKRWQFACTPPARHLAPPFPAFSPISLSPAFRPVSLSPADRLVSLSPARRGSG